MPAVKEHRLDWKDADWAAYLGCSVAEVARYRQILSKNFAHAIVHDKKSGKYYFAFERRYTMSNGGSKLGEVVVASNRHFDTIIEVVHDMNEMISNMRLPAETAENFNIPITAIQMMLRNQRRNYGY